MGLTRKTGNSTKFQTMSRTMTKKTKEKRTEEAKRPIDSIIAIQIDETVFSTTREWQFFQPPVRKSARPPLSQSLRGDVNLAKTSIGRRLDFFLFFFFRYLRPGSPWVHAQRQELNANLTRGAFLLSPFQCRARSIPLRRSSLSALVSIHAHKLLIHEIPMPCRSTKVARVWISMI